MTPKAIYYVEVLPGGTALPYRQRGGKIFTTYIHAVNHKKLLERYGAIARVMTISPVEWKEV